MRKKEEEEEERRGREEYQETERRSGRGRRKEELRLEPKCALCPIKHFTGSPAYRHMPAQEIHTILYYLHPVTSTSLRHRCVITPKSNLLFLVTAMSLRCHWGIVL